MTPGISYGIAISTAEEREDAMTTVQITLPGDLAQKAASVELSAEAMDAMLRCWGSPA
jgi:hypothetical protein